jgi:type IV pilus assembly protein PilV
MKNFFRLPRLRRGKATGFSLVEVMIAVLVLSVGLLGFAATLGVSMRSNQSANFRTQATNLSYQILDRMRANSQNALGYAMGYTAVTGSVTGTSRAREDVSQWLSSIRRALGDSAEARIVLNAGQVTVDIRWTDNRAGTTTAEEQTTFSMTTRI